MNWQTKKPNSYTKSQQFKEEEMGSVGELSKVLLTDCFEMSVFGP